VGPIYRAEGKRAPTLLAGCYRRSLEVAAAHKLKSIAFPSISTGAYGYPLPEAAEVALKATIDFLRTPGKIEIVRFILFGAEAYSVFEEVLKRLLVEEKGA
jgi:O-acetyl-ADP-ribose deacetylase (regulator of RNase III)